MTPCDQTLRAALLAWFQPELRQMPWRETRDPYQIWVSEIMLQQTQVNTVKPYFKRFLAAFPTVQRLAESPLEVVLKHWEGLGYYSRARNLHRGAQLVTQVFSGQLPADPELLQTIPGIGAYTAAAIASIAFNIPVPALDGNVLRVMARLEAIALPVDKAPARRQIRERVHQLMDKQRPGDFNQALMELGATVCLPQNPRCEICPLSTHCKAFAQGLTTCLPVKSVKKNIQDLPLKVFIVRWRGYVLLRQQREPGIFYQLWVLPSLAEGTSLTAEQWLAQETGLLVQYSHELGTLEHVLTHRRLLLTMQVFTLRQDPAQTTLPAGWEWRAPYGSAHTIPVAYQKVLRRLKHFPDCA